MLTIDQIDAELKGILPVSIEGRIIEICGPILRAYIQGVSIGDLVKIDRGETLPELMAQAVGFRKQEVILTPFDSPNGIHPGSAVNLCGPIKIGLGVHLLGSVLDSLGNTIETIHPKNHSAVYASPLNSPPPALERKPIDQIFSTGIRAIDAFVTLGKGQRVALYAEPGVGKSTLMANIATNSDADVNVIALIGERGREVRDLVLNSLDETTRARTVIVVSTSDEAAIRRQSAASTAIRIAEHFRAEGRHVLLQVDSLTRLFRAMREVGLASGEVPVRHGYPPSAFAELPRLIERAGTNSQGSITAIYTVLLSSDLDQDPMVEETKGLLDGHIILRRDLAENGHFPAVDISSSLSRLANKLTSKEHHRSQQVLREIYVTLRDDKDLAILSNETPIHLQRALRLEPELVEFLKQGQVDNSPFEETRDRLIKLAKYADSLA
jgi:FliI/YscN family ATPase